MVSGGARPGIALPMVLLVLVALSVLSSLALFDAVQSIRGARLAEGEARARAAAISGVEGLFSPPDPPWLCLQPPAAPLGHKIIYSDGASAELRWWSLGAGRVRGEVVGVGRTGGRHRRFAALVADSLPLDSLTIGCPSAEGLRPSGSPWLAAHPDG